MRCSIATVSLSGMLRKKVRMIAAAGVDGVEYFESDLLQFSAKPREVCAACTGLALAIDMSLAFLDFDGTTCVQMRRSLDGRRRRFDVMDELGTVRILTCSDLQTDAPGDRIHFAQPAEAPWADTDALTHSRLRRRLPGEGEFEVAGFLRAVLGLQVQHDAVLHDPHDVIRSREIELADKAVRTSLMVSERDNTAIPRHGGAGVQQVAIAVEDVVAPVSSLRGHRVPLLPVPGSGGEDFAAKHDDLAPRVRGRLAARRRALGLRREGRVPAACRARFEDRFEFDFVERHGGHDLYGSTSAPVRLAELTALRMARDTSRSS